MSFRSTSSPPSTPIDLADPSAAAIEVARLRRMYAASQEELAEATNAKRKRTASKATTMGRGIRKVVSLFETLSSILDEADQQMLLDQGDDLVIEPLSLSPADEAVAKRARERTLTSYALLLRLVPQLKKVIEDPDMESLNTFLAALQDGANGARADDIKRIKEEISNWINLDYKPVVPLNPKCREGRGLAHDLCGELLSPIEFNWQDLEVRANIRNQKDGYTINNNNFLRCLYPKGRYDPKLVERNFLRSRLLVQVYCSIFTSPSSAEGLEDLDESVNGPARKKKKTSGQKNATKTNVATLLNMDGRVSSRSIAYAAVLLVFNLTDATQWVEVYNGFNFVMFYNFLVDYLEVFRNDAKKNRVESLLAWWNSNVFPHHVATAPESDESQDLLAAQEARADLELL